MLRSKFSRTYAEILLVDGITPTAPSHPQGNLTGKLKGRSYENLW